MKAQLSDLEATLGHAFAAPELLVRALTHRSLANEMAVQDRAPAADVVGQHKAAAPLQDNERLEFLGDAVLGLVVAEALFREHPAWNEGELTRVRAQLVSRQHLAVVAGSLGLGKYLRISQGEDRSGLRKKATVLSNTMEAVLGALFVDGGLEPVKRFSVKYVMAEAEQQLAQQLQSGAALGNYKSALQEFLQSARMGVPEYHVKRETGPAHRRRFLVEVRLTSGALPAAEPLARGQGTTKKHAEQDAARRALEGFQSTGTAADASSDPAGVYSAE
jgi:ribonuclease-3